MLKLVAGGREAVLDESQHPALVATGLVDDGHAVLVDDSRSYASQVIVTRGDDLIRVEMTLYGKKCVTYIPCALMLPFTPVTPITVTLDANTKYAASNPVSGFDWTQRFELIGQTALVFAFNGDQYLALGRVGGAEDGELVAFDGWMGGL